MFLSSRNTTGPPVRLAPRTTGFAVPTATLRVPCRPPVVPLATCGSCCWWGGCGRGNNQATTAMLMPAIVPRSPTIVPRNPRRPCRRMSSCSSPICFSSRPNRRLSLRPRRALVLMQLMIRRVRPPGVCPGSRVTRTPRGRSELGRTVVAVHRRRMDPASPVGVARSVASRQPRGSGRAARPVPADRAASRTAAPTSRAGRRLRSVSTAGGCGIWSRARPPGGVRPAAGGRQPPCAQARAPRSGSRPGWRWLPRARPHQATSTGGRTPAAARPCAES